MCIFVGQDDILWPFLAAWEPRNRNYLTDHIAAPTNQGSVSKEEVREIGYWVDK